MDEIAKTSQNYSIDDLKLEMAYALCDELRSAQSLKFQPSLLGMLCTNTFQKLGFDTRVQLNIIYTFVVIVVEKEEAHG